MLERLMSKLMDKLGVVYASDHDAAMDNRNRLIGSLRKEIDMLKTEDIEELVRAIRTVNMVKVIVHDTYDGSIREAQHGSVSVEYVEPAYSKPQPKRYRITVELDIGALQRIYEELQMTTRSYNYEVFVESLLREVRTNISTLMRIGDM